MARSLLDFAKSMEVRANSISSVGNQKAIAVALAILRDLGYVSPVDTSLFVSNWQVKLNSRPMDIRPAYFYGEAGSTGTASAQAMIEDGTFALSMKKPGDVIYISNVLPYAQRLNDGYSGQAPAGFVERAVLIGRKVTESKNG